MLVVFPFPVVGIVLIHYVFQKNDDTLAIQDVAIVLGMSLICFPFLAIKYVYDFMVVDLLHPSICVIFLLDFVLVWFIIGSEIICIQ